MRIRFDVVTGGFCEVALLLRVTAEGVISGAVRWVGWRLMEPREIEVEVAGSVEI